MRLKKLGSESMKVEFNLKRILLSSVIILPMICAKAQYVEVTPQVGVTVNKLRHNTVTSLSISLLSEQNLVAPFLLFFSF